jgi:hypothetical protein
MVACHQVQDTEIAQTIFKRLLKPTDIDHSLESSGEHFPMVSLVFWFNHFRGMLFLNFWWSQLRQKVIILQGN